MTSNNLAVNISSLKRKLDMAAGRRNEIKKSLKEAQKEKEKTEKNRDLYQKTAAFLSTVINKTQIKMEEIFGNIGTTALEKIFGDGCSLNVSFKRKGQTVRVKIKVKQPVGENKDGEIEFLETDILDGDGGAVVDIVAFTLRVAMLELYSPRQDGPLMLDETFRFIANDEKMHLCGEFMRELTDKTQRQMILITHEKTLLPYADKVFSFSLHPNKTVKISDITLNGEEEFENEES